MKKVIIVCLLSINFFSFSCRVNVVNDIKSSLFVIDTFTGEAQLIKKGKSKTLGSKKHRPVMKIYVKNNDLKLFQEMFLVRQVACSKNKEIELKMSEINRKTFNDDIFVVQPRQVDGKFIGKLMMQR